MTWRAHRDLSCRSFLPARRPRELSRAETRMSAQESAEPMNEAEALPLEIDFLDPVDDVEIGRVFRFQVLQRNARGAREAVAIEDLEFSFTPMQWGTVVPSED